MYVVAHANADIIHKIEGDNGPIGPHPNDYAGATALCPKLVTAADILHDAPAAPVDALNVGMAGIEQGARDLAAECVAKGAKAIYPDAFAALSQKLNNFYGTVQTVWYLDHDKSALPPTPKLYDGN